MLVRTPQCTGWLLTAMNNATPDASITEIEKPSVKGDSEANRLLGRQPGGSGRKWSWE